MIPRIRTACMWVACQLLQLSGVLQDIEPNRALGASQKSEQLCSQWNVLPGTAMFSVERSTRHSYVLSGTFYQAQLCSQWNVLPGTAMFSVERSTRHSYVLSGTFYQAQLCSQWNVLPGTAMFSVERSTRHSYVLSGTFYQAQLCSQWNVLPGTAMFSVERSTRHSYVLSGTFYQAQLCSQWNVLPVLHWIVVCSQRAFHWAQWKNTLCPEERSHRNVLNCVCWAWAFQMRINIAWRVYGTGLQVRQGRFS